MNSSTTTTVIIASIIVGRSIPTIDITIVATATAVTTTAATTTITATGFCVQNTGSHAYLVLLRLVSTKRLNSSKTALDRTSLSFSFMMVLGLVYLLIKNCKGVYGP